MRCWQRFWGYPHRLSRGCARAPILNKKEKAYELAALFVRVYRSLDAIVGGDDAVAVKWLQADNIALGDKPVNMIQKVTGLFHVLQYLDARRALG